MTSSSTSRTSVGPQAAPVDGRSAVPSDASSASPTTRASQSPTSRSSVSPATPEDVRPVPRVVVFRANALDTDSRAKKISLTLARLGYDVVALSAEDEGPEPPERRLGPVRVVGVPIAGRQRDLQRARLIARRHRPVRVVDWTTKDEYVTRIQELKSVVGCNREIVGGLLRPAAAAPAEAPWRRWPKVVVWSARYVAARVRLTTRRARWRAQWTIDVTQREGWRRWDLAQQRRVFGATTRGMLPEVEDFAASFGPVLDRLEPDLIHVHHPMVLGTAVRAARRRIAQGAPCRVIYDAREDFLGLPRQEQGHPRRHSVLVREEARYIHDVDAVVTVSEPITHTLQQRYQLAVRPSLVLNMPLDDPSIHPGAVDAPTVRERLGLAAEVPLILYSGAVSRARGVDLAIEALPLLPGVHLVVVPVPYPHPHQGELIDRAADLGVADRLHFCPPVEQDTLLHYLSGADIGLMPFRTGSANIEQALPNKLFEYLHAGLVMVTSDAKAIRDFVTEHDLGEVFADGDPAALAAAVTLALVRRDENRAHPDADARHQAATAALRHRFSWQGQEAVIRDLYTSLVPSPRPHGIDVESFGSLTIR